MKVLLLAVAIAAALSAGASALAHGSGASRARGAIDPAEFSAHVDNPWFPLIPGTTYVYTGVKDGKPARDVVVVSHRTATIAGVPCAVVEDRLYLAGHLEERTIDYYTQHSSGTVWYYGEQTAELDEKGHVTSTEGSWRAERNGAKAGIFMPADPQVGKSYRQEYYKGHAEDHFQIIGLLGTVTGPAAKNALLTKEWTPLEPGAIDHKLYVYGIGVVVESAIKGGDEHMELVSVQTGS